MKTKLFMLALAMIAILFGCSTDPVDDPLITQKGNGVVVLKITDAPFPADLVEKALVTIDWVKLKKANIPDGVGEDDPNSYIILLEKDSVVDLLQLSNGITKILSKAEVPAGEYSEIRMHIKESGVKIVDDTTKYSLKIPSGSSSGLKIKVSPALVVTEGTENELVLDVDVSRSFKIIGNDKGKKGIKGFMFSPVVRAAAISQSGKIQGTVSETGGAKIKNAWVVLFTEKTVDGKTSLDTIAGSKTTTTGNYTIIGIPAGTYKMGCSAEGYKPEPVIPITINKGESKTQDFVLEK